MIFLKFAFLFFIGSILGWCIELIFRRFFSPGNHDKKWINPGFLVGPYLPLYGSGLCTLYLLANIPVVFVENEIMKKIVLFFIMTVAMTFIEYLTGVIFILKMKVKLWDYSKNRGNIQGIICPLFSFFWGVLGAFYYICIHPHIENALYWLSENLAFSFVIGMFYGVFVIDLCYSFRVVAKIRQFAKDYDIVVKYEELKSAIRHNDDRVGKGRFLFAFRTTIPMYEHAKRYLELQAVFGEEEIKKKLEMAAGKARVRAEAAAERARKRAEKVAQKAKEKASQLTGKQ